MNFEGFAPLRLTEEEYDILKTLRRLADRSGFEYGIAAQLRERTTGEILWKSETFTSCDRNRVRIPEAVLALKNLTLYHAHTNNSLFSVQDLRLLLSPSIEKICVISVADNISSAFVGTGYEPDEAEFLNAAKRIGQEVDMDLLQDPQFWDWSEEERNERAICEQAFRIATHFKWAMEGGNYVYKSFS